jgi:hypothetical protein
MVALARSWWQIALSAVWLFAVCYPDPRLLWQSVLNTFQPPIHPEAVLEWARTLPNDPAQIERAVHERIAYAVPWQLDGVPWAFSPPALTLARGSGDCQARALVFASVLAAKGIPFQLRASLDHMWIEYAGRPANALENAAKTLWSRSGDAIAPPVAPAAPGKRPGAPKTGAAGGANGSAPHQGGFAVRFPAIDVAESLRLEKEYFWDPAPASRKLLLAAGLLLVWLRPGCVGTR